MSTVGMGMGTMTTTNLNNGGANSSSSSILLDNTTTGNEICLTLLISPTPHLLTSNTPPSPTETQAIRSSISKIKKEISAIYSHPESFSSPSSLLVQCLRFKRAHKPILSAIRRIPQDVLRRIVLMIVNVDGDEVEVGGTVHPWWAITQVCSLWRATALSLSALCGTLPSIPLTTTSINAEYLSILSTGLQKSTKPLTIHAFGRAYLGPIDAQPGDEGLIHPALEILLAHSRRWKHVSFTLSSPFNTADFNARLEANGLPLLTHLRLSIKGPDALPLVLDLPSPNPSMDLFTPPAAEPVEPPLPPPGPIWRCKGALHAFRNAPNLVDVELSDGVPHVELPWSQLRRYKECRVQNPHGAHRIITSPSPCIEELIVQCDLGSVHPIPQPEEGWSQVHLKRLVIEIGRNDTAPRTAVPPPTSLFHYLRCTGLRELRLGIPDVGGIMKHLAPSLKNLRILVLDPPKHIWDREVVARLLESVPLLETLELYHVSRSTLHIVSQEARLVPHLTKVSLYYDTISLDSSDAFAPRSLGGAAPPVHTVNLIFKSAQDCLDTLFVLEGWNLVYNLAEPLRARGKALAIEVEGVGRGVIEGVPEQLTSAGARARRIDNVLRFLEGLEVPYVAYLRMLDIPHYLRKLARVDPLLLPDDVHYKLRARAGALLERWKPHFLEEFEMRKWFRKGQLVLQFVQSRDIETDADYEALLFAI